jgi:formylmethanofuran dehydrogenase subunit E|tara:strand:+ start:175 stop:579 length:405 start_codon:yes stop_codon:yes gene_type:complete
MSDDIVKTLLESLTDEQKAELVKSLMKSEKEEPEQKEEVVSSEIEVNEDFTVTRKINESTRRNPVRARKNKWVDDGSFQLEGEEEFSSNRKRTSRSRGKTKKVQLECSVCGKTYMEHPSLIYGEYHRCNRCGGR